ncbi:hypothetical protein DDB_G0275587 [Dictyostelium discoideum AX4]|uniref:Putative uncharacterized protein DDB_G0275587 n=1 Tax=Dictyostelium discoideum TaxID=44689 RepID=Y7311_DICDI|nr:hypothetical protein DDB_G0275587 [Dictyostelium discoideum AX4]Q86H87.1 RecName: Full=Putative uncharacterized protein DDB_G0275587 [Dictyostelium discoideum]EAL69544.1 hypothetical protein DDB_G0275587 [Dictyostelium discoideum AX4]|eukprot:XP_643420.1 hypothetical protein DDB_G0275587 [Dictyostelium discoideum AX4]
MLFKSIISLSNSSKSLNNKINNDNENNNLEFSSNKTTINPYSVFSYSRPLWNC